MKYSLLRAQREFIEIDHEYSLDVAVYQGGFGSGKTFAGSLLGILLCQKFPGIRGLVGAQTFPLVRDTTMQAYFEHLDNLGFRTRKHYTYLKSEQMIRFKNGSEVMFRHLDEPDKLKSLNLGFVQIEEMSDVPEATFNMLLGRMRQKPRKSWTGFRYRIFGHTNPEQRKGWIYKTFVEDTKPNYRLVKAPTTDNIYLPEGFCNELKQRYNEDYYRINVLGEWGDFDSGLVVKEFKDENIAEITYDKDLPLHISCDFNVDPMSWVLAHRTSNKVFYFDELVIENTTTAATCEELFSRYPDHKGGIVINGDASGNNRSCQSEYTNYMIIRKQLDRLGYQDVEIHIRAFNPPVKNRIIAFNTLVKDFEGNRRLFIDHRCKYLIENLRSLKYKPGTSVLDLPTSYDIRRDKSRKFLGHIFDAASYLVEYYWPLG